MSGVLVSPPGWPAASSRTQDLAATARQNLLFGRLAGGSLESYGLGWKHWSQYCFLRGVLPTPSHGHGGCSDFESRVLDFIVSEQVGQGLTAGTVSSRVYAIRYALITLGYGDMLEWGPRLRLAVKTLKRAKSAGNRKLPVTRAMLEWLAVKLRLGQDGEEVDAKELRVWITVVIAFFFLLRVGEAFNLRFGSLQPRRKGEFVRDWAVADSVSVLISGSKTDQFNLGCVRTQSRVGGLLCPVKVMKMWAGIGPDAEDQLISLGGGTLSRGELQGWLQAAASATGMPPERVGTHSLRIGGATAMMSAGWSLPAIQRFGRWVGEAFQGYLWDTVEASEGLARKMVVAPGTLHVGAFMPPTDIDRSRCDPSGQSRVWFRAAQAWQDRVKEPEHYDRRNEPGSGGGNPGLGDNLPVGWG